MEQECRIKDLRNFYCTLDYKKDKEDYVRIKNCSYVNFYLKVGIQKVLVAKIVLCNAPHDSNFEK